MKILVVGDMHFRYELPYASSIKDGRRSEWEAVKKMVHKTAEDCDAVVLMGDQFNARHNHSSVIRELVDFLNGFGDKELHILTGNHERYGASTALDFLKSLKKKNWHIYLEPKRVQVAGVYAMMIPFMTPSLLGVETYEEGAQAIMDKLPGIPEEDQDGYHIGFIHHALTETKNVGFFNEIVLPRKKLEEYFDNIFVGHVHEKEAGRKTIQVGSIFTQEIGETKKSIWTFETKDRSSTIKQIPLPIRQIRKIIWEDYMVEDIKKQTKRESIPSNSIVKCYVTDKRTDLNDVRAFLKFFDASIIVEQYQSERKKVHFEEGGLDLSVESLLKIYAKVREIEYNDLKEAFDLIK